MQLIGIGTDIVQISRMQKSLNRSGERFVQHILHPHEIEIFQNYQQRYQYSNSLAQRHIAYLAKRFAAKEALSKALGTGISQGVCLTEIEVYNNAFGQPKLKLHGTTAQKAQQLGVKHHYLSLSDEKEYAIAYVVLS
jgi:holo-[acyl-carrier protein] synthase